MSAHGGAHRAATWTLIASGLVGVAVMVLGAVRPWFEGVSGTPAPGARWLGVAVASVAVGLTAVTPRHAWVPGIVTLIVLAATPLTVEPGWSCVDGVDGNGTPIGWCETDAWTSAVVVYTIGGLGAAASAVTAAVVRLLGGGGQAPAVRSA